MCDELLAWAATPFKPLAGEVVFFDLTAQIPHETIAFAAGQCVGYHENFQAGNTGPGAYVCQLLITAPAFTLAAGGPAAPLAAAVTGWAGATGLPAPTPGLTSTTLPAADFAIELYAGGDNVYSVRVGAQVMRIETQGCTRLTEPTTAELGERLGTFRLDGEQKMIFEKAAAGASAPAH